MMKQKGFTLIELLVVISIIGLLASVVLVALNNTRTKARDSKRISDMNQFAKAMELYFNDYSTYPTSVAGSLSSKNNVLGTPNIIPKFISRLPIEPTPADGVCDISGQNTNQYYWVANTGLNLTTTYNITFCVGGKTGSLVPGPHTLTQSGFQ